MLALDEDRDNPWPLLADLRDTHAVASRLAKRSDESMSDEQREHIGVGERPPHLEKTVADEIGPSQLMGKAERNRDVHQEVETMPALVGELGSDVSRGHERDKDHQQRRDSGGRQPRQFEYVPERDS